MIFNLNFLAARYGDSIWIEYGNPDNPHIILIDGGTGGTKKEIKKLINQLPGNKQIELLVVTHIDRDHIEGILSLLEEDRLDCSIGSIWFNGWHHLPQNPNNEFFGAIQGERLTAAILKHRLNWNSHFDKKAVVVPDNKPLPEIILKDNFKITLLSPETQHLYNLRKDWEKEILDANLVPGFGLEEPEDDGLEQFGLDEPDVEALSRESFHEDDSSANGSSIAFTVEYAGKRVLLSGDAFPSVLLKSLKAVENASGAFDLVKLSHHASAHNTSPELINYLNCRKFVIPTNGSIYHHPSRVTIARLIKQKGPGTELYFNYKSRHNRCWDLQELKEKYVYTASYPENEGIRFSLL